MGDSDDDYDRRRRDKFRGERTGGDMRARREDMYDRAGPARSRGDYRVDAYRSGGGRDSRGYSPPNHLSRDISPPPHKRVRADWSGGPDRRYPAGYSAGDSYPVASSNGSSGYGASGYSADSDNPTQPPMMTFKAFLASQDDMITDDEAIKKYTEYKLDFRRQQLSNFFLAHKEEEWFKAKYHPDDHAKKQEEHTKNLKRRIEVFMESLDEVDKVALDGDNASAILRLLDSVVIRLENGTELDLTVLDLPDDDEPDKSDEKPFILDAKKNRDDANKNAEDLSQMEMTEEQKLLQQKAKEFLKKKEESKKRKYTSGSSSGSSSSSDSSSDSEDDGAGKAAKAGKARKLNQPAPPGENGDRPLTPPPIKLPLEELAAADGDMPLEAAESEVKVEAEATAQKDDEDKATDGAKKTAAVADVQPTKPRPLHKTASIFLRNLAPTITKQEVEAMCRRYPGFLRAAIADPQPDRRWFRRGWVTFERHVNIKEICWNLNNIRLRDCELGAIVNRDLSRRVRTVNGVTSHRTVVRADIKLSARIIQNLDSRHRLWCQPAASPPQDQREQGETGDEQEQTYGVTSQNPILRNITDYLIEEASAEEEELLGVNVSSACPEEAAGTGTSGNGTAPAADTVERDEALIKVLDKLLLYLRVVHSVDYYNHSEYPNEDEMPNRCGIIHTRGIPPTSKVTANETQDYIKSFGNKIGSFLQPLPRLSEDDCKKNGLVLKDPEEETEKFVQANTQELSKDKWLCPLSNKKFKGPDFVRKHIFNKHAEKVEEVKKEVEFFNNYLRDPKRPQLLEHPSKGAPAASGSNSSSSSRRGDEPPAQFHVGPYPQPAPPPPHPGYGGAYGGPYQRGPMYGGYQAAPPRDPYYREPYLPPRDAYPRPPRPYGRRYNRPLNSYRDLDAPKEIDEF